MKVNGFGSGIVCPAPELRGLVARMQRLSRLRDWEKQDGVKRRLACFYLDQLEGKSPRPL